MSLNPPEEPYISGKICRNRFYFAKRQPKIREVDAFTPQAMQKNTVVIPLPKTNIYKSCPKKRTLFSVLWSRGDIPACMTNDYYYQGNMNTFPVEWFCNPQNLDYCYYLPIFMDGFADRDHYLRDLAKFGAMDLIVRNPHKVLPVLSKCILPLRRAMDTKDKIVIMSTLRVIQLMVFTVPCIGPRLVPFYRQLFRVLNIFKNINVHLMDGIDMNTRLGDVIEDTLRMLEQCGGPDAYINIKYMIPTYESYVQPGVAPNKPCLQEGLMAKRVRSLGTPKPATPAAPAPSPSPMPSMSTSRTKFSTFVDERVYERDEVPESELIIDATISNPSSRMRGRLRTLRISVTSKSISSYSSN